MIFPLILTPIITLCTINYSNHLFRAGSFYSLIKFYGSNLSHFSKLITLLSLHVNFSYGIYLWKTYPKRLAENVLIYPSSSLFELQHNLNLPFIILSSLVLIIALLSVWYSEVNTQLFLNLLLVLEICLVAAFSCTNLFLFLLFFELSALPIFLFIIYCGSVRRERLKASYYFMFFTLYGSLSLLFVILNIFSVYQLDFNTNFFFNSYSMWILLFIAFAVKIPLFPFHVWLPYAHVEASTSTSILLAALMLKLGGYGLLKFMLPLFSPQIHLFFKPLAILISVLGIIYGGLSALRQIDLKRQIAFSSISHMSFATLGIFTFTEIGIKAAIYLMLSHGLTSTALFYLVGILSERYHTRSILSYSGLYNTMPLFTFFLLIASLANIGFPGTSGFLPEFLVVVSILNDSAYILLPTILGMFLTTASTLIMLLRLCFGHTKLLYTKSSYSDLVKLEFFILSILSFLMILLGLYDILPANID